MVRSMSGLVKKPKENDLFKGEIMTTMTEEWVSFWYQCLAKNMDYWSYSIARREDDVKKCMQFESKFELIADLYQDFGELEDWPKPRMNSQQWKDWFEPRKHLFLSVATVSRPAGYVLRPDRLLLEVQLQEDSVATMKLVGEFVKDYYERFKPLPAPSPKYSLLQKIDGKTAPTHKVVKKACASVVRSYRYDLDTYEELLHVDAVAAFARHEIDNFGWNLDREARTELAKTGRLSPQRLESIKTMLNRSRREFVAFSKNTIRGRFPDFTPFDSKVCDLF